MKIVVITHLFIYQCFVLAKVRGYHGYQIFETSALNSSVDVNLSLFRRFSIYNVLRRPLSLLSGIFPWMMNWSRDNLYPLLMWPKYSNFPLLLVKSSSSSFFILCNKLNFLMVFGRCVGESTSQMPLVLLWLAFLGYMLPFFIIRHVATKYTNSKIQIWNNGS